MEAMAAVRQLELAGLAEDYLLCYFHMLQDWERFVRSAQSGVTGKQPQHELLVHLSSLAHNDDKEVFKKAVRALKGPAASGQEPGSQKR